jgi:hypothetical protein
MGRAALLLALVGSGLTACVGETSIATDEGDVAEAQSNLNGAGGTATTSAVSTTGAVTTGVSTSGVGGGSSGSGGSSGGTVGLWLFDDCSAASTTLLDSSGAGSTATRSATTACAPGIDGLGVDFDNKKDMVTVPDSSALTFTTSMTVAAWIHPSKVTGTHSIVDKQTNSKLSFSLGIKAGSVQFSIGRVGKSTIVTSAPVSANAWTHVAGVFDGTFVFLFINGQQVGQVFAGGTLKDANAPVRIGNNAQQESFLGTIDRVLLTPDPLSASDIAALTCIHRPPTLTASPLASGPVAAGTAVTYNVSATNNDVGSCQQDGFFLFGSADPPGLTSTVNPQFFFPVASGQTVVFPFTVTSTDEAEPGINQVPFSLFDFNQGVVAAGSVAYEVVAPTGCFVRTSRELMIKNVSVVDDPVRTNPGDTAVDPRAGAWTFGHLMENMAPSAAAAPDFVEQLFSTWLADRTVNGFTVPARTFMQAQVLDTWPRTANGKLDLTKSPLRLLSIVDRLDLRNLALGNAGEGRFVFGVLDAQGFPLQFTVILEYHLPATTQAQVLDWASSWHALGNHPFPSEEYNVALQALTERFTGRNAAPGLVNGSALSQLRTNEIALSNPWELREFTLSPATGFLQEDTIKLTPDLGFDGTPRLADFINQNEPAILAEQHTVPPSFQGSPFLGGAVFNNLTAWKAPGINNNEARHHFSLNTCNGCHSAEETGTFFLQVNPRFPGSEAQLSGFLTGITVSDPVTFQPRTFNDLARRKADLTQLVCAPPPAAPVNGKVSAASASQAAFISKGISRVH